MSFVSKYILNKASSVSLKELALVINGHTRSVIQTCKAAICDDVTSGQNWMFPDARCTVGQLDSVSNECCKVIDSSLIIFKNFSEGNQVLQTNLIESMNDVNDFFGSEYLNMNRRLLSLLITIKCNHVQQTLMDREDSFLLDQLIQDLNQYQRQIHNPGFDRSSTDLRISQLHKQFMKNLSDQKHYLTLSKVELGTIPNRRLLKKYGGDFRNDKESKTIQFESKSEFELAKYSHFPEVRRKAFLALTNGNRVNTKLVVELLQLRQQTATQIYNEQSYFNLQSKLQTIKLHGSLLDKIKRIQAAIRPQTLRDIQLIKQITGEPDMRFCDISLMKEKMKGILIARDPNNIQMLTCFTLQNAIKGLMLLAVDIFNLDINLKTVIVTLDGNGNKKIEEFEGFNLLPSKLNSLDEDQIPLLELTLVKNNGKIIMDLFNRKYKLQKHQTQTLTEQGSKQLDEQNPVAYMVDCIQRDVEYLNFEQVKNIFHEFGHALNIAMSNTKYQHYSCARATTDLVEIPSHFAELFLKNYDFVSKFATVQIQNNDSHRGMAPLTGKRVPIERDVFNKMVFCDEIFSLINLEESLYFTRLDVEFNSFRAGEEITEERLLEINYQSLSESFSCNQIQDESILPKLTDDQIKLIVESTLSIESTISKKELFKSISDILFSKADLQGQLLEGNIDPEKTKDFKENYLFNSFHHLFEYDATYYSYLLAKIASQKLYATGVMKDPRSQGLKLEPEIYSLFESGAMFDYKDISK